MTTGYNLSAKLETRVLAKESDALQYLFEAYSLLPAWWL